MLHFGTAVGTFPLFFRRIAFDVPDRQGIIEILPDGLRFPGPGVLLDCDLFFFADPDLILWLVYRSFTAGFFAGGPKEFPLEFVQGLLQICDHGSEFPDRLLLFLIHFCQEFDQLILL